MYVRNPRLYHVWQIILDVVALFVVWQCAIPFRISLNPVAISQVTPQAATLWAPPLGFLIAIVWVGALASLPVVPEPGTGTLLE